MKEELIKLLNEYKESKRSIEIAIEWLEKRDYAQGKLDLVNTIIADLEKLVDEKD